jgi:hypothetical protein
LGRRQTAPSTINAVHCLTGRIAAPRDNTIAAWKTGDEFHVD